MNCFAFDRRSKHRIKPEETDDFPHNDTKILFWNEIRKNLGKNRTVSTVIDHAQTEDDISKVFANKYQELYNSVPYDIEEMNRMKVALNKDVVSKCCSGLCDTSHTVTTQDVIDAVKKLKPYKV